MLSIFTMPENAITSTTAYIGDLITDAWPFIALAIGIPLAFYVVRKLISLARGGAR